MDIDLIMQIVVAVLFVVSLFCGLKWKQAKGLLKEVAEALTATSDALEDNDITALERKKLFKEWGDVIMAAKGLVGK